MMVDRRKFIGIAAGAGASLALTPQLLRAPQQPGRKRRLSATGQVVGAHPTRPAKIDDQFSMGVPFARSVNPITKTNGEGTGVTPNVRVPAAQALETARNLIAKKATS